VLGVITEPLVLRISGYPKLLRRKVAVDNPVSIFSCGGGLFLLGFSGKTGAACGVFVVKSWWNAW
jgi:hypothetical protein